MVEDILTFLQYNFYNIFEHFYNMKSCKDFKTNPTKNNHQETRQHCQRI